MAVPPFDMHVFTGELLALLNQLETQPRFRHLSAVWRAMYGIRGHPTAKMTNDTIRSLASQWTLRRVRHLATDDYIDRACCWPHDLRHFGLECNLFLLQAIQSLFS
eukprot:NODE_4283_length_678_cov_82.069952_g3644_i0.p3 GENE.NODE_4283_length_678_cov_82.069952_g3644_i0~~NODE_4283_length_678_cov_82.069952_g3644_i0.p3  ORF type:complete len:106 (+),score=28.97 NODE_4283_length_678_cov_82.069952_g3644_i0:302-619(+)